MMRRAARSGFTDAYARKLFEKRDFNDPKSIEYRRLVDELLQGDPTTIENRIERVSLDDTHDAIRFVTAITREVFARLQSGTEATR